LSLRGHEPVIPPRTAFEKEIRNLGQGRHQLWRVFADFCEMAAITWANIVPRDPALEARYLAIVGRYEREEVEVFPRLMGHLIDGLEDEPFGDFLGAQFMALELGNHWKGQYFTPTSLCDLMARMLYSREETAAHVAAHGFITLHEPAVGGAAMVLAFTGAMRAAGLNPQQHLYVQAIDVDSTAAYMAYVQLALHHIPAVVYVGNTLTLELREAWRTPAHHLGFWSSRLRARERVAATGEEPEQKPAPDAPGLLVVTSADVTLPPQTDLFATASAPRVRVVPRPDVTLPPQTDLFAA